LWRVAHILIYAGVFEWWNVIRAEWQASRIFMMGRRNEIFKLNKKYERERDGIGER
jgi:hypothetical protein